MARNYKKGDYKLKYKDPEWAVKYHIRWRTENPEKYLLSKSKKQAKDRNIEFTLTLEDIVIPECCPVLGVKLAIGRCPINSCYNAPSIDRLDSSKGYIKDNINVISWRANQIKNNGTLEEHKKLVEWMETKLAA